MPDPKVVSLKPGRKPASTIPPIVAGLRKQAHHRILLLLKELLDCTDDALFEMADRSQSNADHHLYFDSMRQIRLHRSQIEQRFLARFDAGFDEAFSPATGAGVTGTEPDADHLGLVTDDDLEISVAVSGITSKITSQFSLPIMELTKRLDHLAKRGTVSERLNPLGPQMVSEAFGAAIESIDVDIKIRIILLKLFERMVMQRMGPIYDEANRALTDAGVLKDLRRSLSRGRNPHAGVPRSSGRAGTGVAGDRSQGPLARGYAGNGQGGYTGERAAESGHPAGNGSGGSGYPGGSSADGGRGHGGPGDVADRSAAGGAQGASGVPGTGGFMAIQNLLAGVRLPGSDVPASGSSIIATPAVVDLLTSVQQETPHQRGVIEDAPALLDLRQVVTSRAPDVTGRAMNHLGRADEDVVNFIGMLFDYILNDRNLAIPMKALIARLQIPIVKLAIIDKNFFDRSSHPARQLLNELSSAGIGWSSAAELKRDAVYDMIESVVIRVLNGFGDNPSIFDDLLAELRGFRAHDKARHARMEQRVKETEAGRARTLEARQQVQQVINQKVCGLRLPSDLGRFVSDVWSRALVYVSLREGQGSSSWESLILTLDDLVWTLQPLDDLQQIQRRDDMTDDLLARLGAGMKMVELAEAEQDHWCTLIRDQLAEMTCNDRLYLEDDEAPRPSDDFGEMEEIVLAAPHEVTDSYQGEAPMPDFVERINQLSEGCWVEIHKEDDKVLRCKLAAIVRPGDRYVFVNRRGMKVAEKTRMELARELQDDKLVMLNDSEVFDRALQAVIGNLRQIQERSTVTAGGPPRGA